MRKQKRWLQWLFLPILIVAVMFAVEGICNARLLTLPTEQQGEVALDLSQLTVTPPAGEDPYAEDAGEGVYLPMGTVYADLDWSGYIRQLRLSGVVYSDTAYIIQCTLPDGTVKNFSSVYVSALGADNIQIGENVIHIRFYTDIGDLTLTEMVIDNTARLNPVRMLFSGLCVAAVYLLWMLRKLVGQKPEYGFLIVGLCCGIFLATAMPAVTALSFDDQIHFESVWNLSFGKYLRTSASSDSLAALSWTTAQNDSFIYAQDTYADYLRLVEQVDAPASNVLTEPSSAGRQQWTLTNTGYITQALGMALARWMGLPMHMQIIAARLGNMLGYVLLCFAAIHFLKRFKLTFAAIALMPTPMFMASNFSYDPLCTGLCMLGTALIIDAMLDRDTRISWKRLLGIFVSFMLACNIKAVYAPLLLLVLLLPRSKFASRGQAVYVKVISMVLMLVAVGGILLDISGDINVIQDTRGDGADSAGQIAFVLSHPLTYFGYFISALWNGFQVYLLDSPRLTWAYLGSCSGIWAAFSLMLLLITCYTDNDTAFAQRVSWQQRIGLLLVAGIATGLMFTAMYVGFSAVGSSSFGGVQGRYMLPVLPLFALLLSPNGVKNAMNKTGWHMVFSLGNLLILMATCYELVLVNLML